MIKILIVFLAFILTGCAGVPNWTEERSEDNLWAADELGGMIYRESHERVMIRLPEGVEIKLQEGGQIIPAETPPYPFWHHQE
jgi:hypothetical protein